MNPQTILRGVSAQSLNAAHRITSLAFALLLLVSLAGVARGALNAVVDLAGATFSHGVSFTRTSAPATLDASSRYAYKIEGTVHGTGLLSAAVSTNTDVGDFLDRVQPGSSSLLSGIYENPGGVLPFTFMDRHFEGTTSTPLGNIFVALDAVGVVDATGLVSFSVSNVTVTFGGSPLAGGLQFEDGSKATIAVSPKPIFSKAGYTGLGGGENYGFIHFNTTAAGKLTGFLFSDGRKYPFAGKFDDQGVFTKTFRRPGIGGAAAQSVALNLRLAADGESFDGEFGAAAFSGERDEQGTNVAPAAEAGTHNALLAVTDLTPAGGPLRGILALKIRPTGAATFVGALPDGTLVKGASQISITGKLPIAVGLYKGKAGFLAGESALAQTDLLRWTGALHWTKPAGSAGLYGQTGLTNVAAGLAGARYVPPAANARVLSDLTTSNGAATVTLSTGNLSAPVSKAVTVDAKNKVTIATPGADKLSIKIAAKTGLFSGSFLDGSARRKLKGIFVQDVPGAQTGDGFFLGTDAAGRVLVEAN